MRNKYSVEFIEEAIMNYVREKFTIGYSQRLGQWFYNTFDTSGIPFPELFYEPTLKKAIDLIYQNYLEQ